MIGVATDVDFVINVNWLVIGSAYQSALKKLALKSVMGFQELNACPYREYLK